MAWASVAAQGRGQDMPEMPKPTKEHQQLEQFAGKWTSEAEATMPNGESMVCKGVETSKLMGGFWLVAEGEGEMMGQKMGSLMTIGYDAKAKQYVGTFVCSAQDHLWKYTGKFDETGKKLVLETTGPSMIDPKQQAKYQETLELVDEDHKVFSSFVEGADGKWQPIMTAKYTRVR
jgi:hypothetical protein